MLSVLSLHPLVFPYFCAYQPMFHQPTSLSKGYAPAARTNPLCPLTQRAWNAHPRPPQHLMTNAWRGRGGVNTPTPPLISQDNSEVCFIPSPRTSLQESAAAAHSGTWLHRPYWLPSLPRTTSPLSHQCPCTSQINAVCSSAFVSWWLLGRTNVWGVATS